MFERNRLWGIGMGLLLLAPWPGSWAADDADDLGGMKRDIAELKAGQQQIAREVAEIKQLLQALKKPQQRRQLVQDVDLVMDLAQEPFLGDANAPLTLVEMTDYQCPFCGRYAKTVMPRIVKDYVDTGKLKYVLRDFPLVFHKDAKKAAEAARCAGSQGKYWEMHDLLFENQKALGAEHLAGYAAQLELDPDAFKSCLESGEYTRKVEAGQTEGAKAGVSGTPTFFLGRTGADGQVKLTKRITGAQPYPVFQKELQALLSAEEK